MGNHQHTRPKVGGSLTISVSAVNADGDRLSDLIEAALPGLEFGLNATAGDITGEFAATLDGTQQTTLADIINGFLPVGYPGEPPIIVPSARPLFFQVNLADYAEIAGDTLEYWNSEEWVDVPRTSFAAGDHARFEATYSPPPAEEGKLYVRFDTDDTKVVLLDHWLDADRNGTDNSNYFVRQTNLSGSAQFRDTWFAPTSDAYVTWPDPHAALDAAVLALGATPQHWKLDDAEGLVFADSGPLGYDFTQSGGVTADFEATGPTAIITKAYKFDGVNNRGTVVVTDRPEFNAAGKFTAMLWVDNGGAGQSAKWLFGHYGGGWPWQFTTEGTDEVMADIRNGSDMKRYVIPDVMDGGPHHIAMTFDDGVFKVFKDGAEIVSPQKVKDDAITTVEVATGPMNIGRRDTGSWAQFDGAHAIFVQEVATPAEIANIYTLSGGV